MRNLTIILDPAHGANVSGKASPDGSHLEFLWSRDECQILYDMLIEEGFKVVWDNLTQDEIGLMERRRYANKVPGDKKLLISLHNNAAANHGWQKARGYEIYTWIGQTKSDDIATEILNQIDLEFQDLPGLTKRVDYTDGDPDKESKFTILGGNYYAVLLEWLFMDNKEDLLILKDSHANYRLAKAITRAVVNMDNLV